MKTAYCMIRERPEYRREVFVSGLKALGYRVTAAAPSVTRPEDLVVIWNRYAVFERLADRHEARGGTVVVAENGYFQRPHFGGTHFALAIGGHNGQGRWPAGDPQRWNALGIEVKPWRASGTHVLVCPNRAFGRRGYVMPPTWANDVVAKLRRVTKRPIRVRPHPGNVEATRPLAEDLRDAWTMVIWSSSTGVHSLVAGVPVVCCSPAWICKGAAAAQLAQVDNPPMPERLPHFERLATAQWTGDEIRTGEAFARLLRPA